MSTEKINRAAICSIFKEAYGKNDKSPSIDYNKNIIIPTNSLISHKYTFILECLINFNSPFSFADYANNNGLFSCLLAQDFENITCYIMNKTQNAQNLCKKIKKAIELPNLITKKATIKSSKIITDVTFHEIETLKLLHNLSPKKLASFITNKTKKFTIIEMPSNKGDKTLKKILGEKLSQIEPLFSELLKYFFIITYIPVVYNQKKVSAYYLLEKR